MYSKLYINMPITFAHNSQQYTGQIIELTSNLRTVTIEYTEKEEALVKRKKFTLRKHGLYVEYGKNLHDPNACLCYAKNLIEK